MDDSCLPYRSKLIFLRLIKADFRLELLDTPHPPLQDQATRGLQTTSPLAPPISDLTLVSVLPSTSGMLSTAV